ncbi:MAG: hypothetical protein ACYS99_08450 [Planctomycetota bacterium]|jgi:hypothetical protein
MESLSDRVARLEVQNRRLRAVLTATALVVVGLIAMGQAAPSEAPKEIRARRFVVVDEDGVEHASLDEWKLKLIHPDSRASIELEVADSSAWLWINSSEWNGHAPWVHLEANRSGEHGACAVSLSGRVELEVDELGPHVRVCDKEHHPRAELGLAVDESPLLGLYDAKERIRLRAYVSALLDESGLDVIDREGDLAFRARE